MQRADPVLLFDLDGTILRINSFPVWVAFLALGCARNVSMAQQLTVTAMVLRLLLLRKMRRLDHATFLRRTQALWDFTTAGDGGAAARRFARRLMRLVRSNMQPVLKLVSDGVLDGIIATAAAENYAPALGERLGVPHVLATRAGRDATEPDNSGEHKRTRVMAWLRDRDWSGRPLIFFNDHLADTPMMRQADIVCWFGSARDLVRARREAPTVRFVDCRQLNTREMHATMAHLIQSLVVTQMQRGEASRASTLA